jgi:serine/threonine protein kinase
MSQVDEAWRVKVCDFGLARKMPPAHERKHLSVVGTDEWCVRLHSSLRDKVSVTFCFYLSSIDAY